MEIGEKILNLLGDLRILPDLTDLVPAGETCCLVGGAVRDAILERPAKDLDFATSFDPTGTARALARKTGGAWFFLDEKRRQSRILIGRDGEAMTLDFAPFRGPDLTADLRGRDFTVNSVAVSFTGSEGPGLIDPLGGVDDLLGHRLRDCSPTALKDDPLRVLRGVRFMLQLELQPDRETLERMRSASPLLTGTAPERVREELTSVLNAFSPGRVFPLLKHSEALSVLFGPSGIANGFEEGLALSERVDEALEGFGEIRTGKNHGDLFDEEVDDGFTRRGLLKLAGFIRGYGSGEGSVPPMGEKFRLSRKNRSILENLMVLSPQRAKEAESLPETERSRALWMEDLGPDPPGALLFALVLNESPSVAKGRFSDILRSYLALSAGEDVPPLVDGRWIIEHTAISPGPGMGEALKRLRREEIAGRVKNRGEAEDFLRKIGAESN